MLSSRGDPIWELCEVSGFILFSFHDHLYPTLSFFTFLDLQRHLINRIPQWKLRFGCTASKEGFRTYALIIVFASSSAVSIFIIILSLSSKSLALACVGGPGACGRISRLRTVTGGDWWWRLFFYRGLILA